MPAAATGGRGSVFSTGFARPQASRSAAPRSTKKPSAGSRNTTPISNSTGPRFSKRNRLPPPRPTTRAPAAHAATAIVHGRPDQPPRSPAAHPKGTVPASIRRTGAPGTGTPGTRAFGTGTLRTGTVGIGILGTYGTGTCGTGTSRTGTPGTRTPGTGTPGTGTPGTPRTRSRSGLRAAHAPRSGGEDCPPGHACRAKSGTRAAHALARAICGASGTHYGARWR